MIHKINADPKHIIGKRPNLSAQNSAVDEVVAALSVPPERMPLPPLSPLPPTKPSPKPRKNPQAGSIVGAILVFLPFVYTVVFFLHGETTGHPLPAILFPLLVLITRIFSHIGGLVLYLSARAAQYLRKSIGFGALFGVLLPIAGTILLAKPISAVDPYSIRTTQGWIALGCLAAALLCMTALCVFSVFLLTRVFRKRKPEPIEP
jgi:hypothetical protein